MSRLNQFLLVATGSALGAAVRWLTISSFSGLSDRWVVLALNIFGSAVLGGVLGWASDKHRPDMHLDRIKLGAGTGFCGGLTSFSTFIVDIAELLRAGTYSAALSTTLTTVASVTIVAAAGYNLTRPRL